MSQVQQSRVYYNFINAIRSPATRYVYHLALKRYQKHYNLNLEELLTIPDKQERIIDYLLSLNGHQSRLLIRNTLKKFYEMNDVVLNWKKVSAYLGESGNINSDRAYTHEEIKTLVDAADMRMKVILLVLASTGMRLGALPSLKVKDIGLGDPRPTPVEVPPNGVSIYSGTKDKYITFCTPECSNAIRTYLDYRKRCGEKITPDSLLIRKRFDMDDLEAVKKNVKPISTDTLGRILDNHLIKCGLRTVNHVDPNKRKEVARAHGFRKFFTTQLVNAKVNPEIREMLLGHKIGLTSAYYRPAEADLLEEYQKAIDALTIEPSQRLQKKITQMEKAQDKFDKVMERVETLEKELGIG